MPPALRRETSARRGFSRFRPVCRPPRLRAAWPPQNETVTFLDTQKFLGNVKRPNSGSSPAPRRRSSIAASPRSSTSRSLRTGVATSSSIRPDRPSSRSGRRSPYRTGRHADDRGLGPHPSNVDRDRGRRRAVCVELRNVDRWRPGAAHRAVISASAEANLNDATPRSVATRPPTATR